MYKELTIKTTLSDITIADMYAISKLTTKKELSDFEKNIELLYILGGEQVEELPIDLFTDITKSINLNIDDSYKVKETVELPKITLRLKGDANDFKFSVKQIIAIKKHMLKDTIKYVHLMLKEIYTIDVIEPVGDMDDYIINNVTMDVAAPFITLLSNKYGK